MSLTEKDLINDNSALYTFDPGLNHAPGEINAPAFPQMGKTDWPGYDLRSMGEQFYSNGTKHVSASLLFYDPKKLFKEYRIKEESVTYKKKKIQAALFVTVSDFEVRYNTLTVNDNEMAVFAVKSGNNFTFRIKLGNGLLKESKFDNHARLKATIWNLTDVKRDYLIAQGLSVKTIIQALNAQTPLFEENDNITGLMAPRKKIHLNVGIFFDGTGNNKYNSDAVYYKSLDKNYNVIPELYEDRDNVTVYNRIEGENRSATKDIETDSSFWNPYSNVALLYEVYKTGKKDEAHQVSYTLKQYVQGIGTLALDEDDFIIGTGLAEGSRGIIGKINEGCKNLALQIKNLVGEQHIDSIAFDVFGFSRGAAAARHFCNEILGKESARLMSGAISPSKYVATYENLLTQRGDYPPHNKIVITQSNVKKLKYEKLELGRLGKALKSTAGNTKPANYDFERVTIGENTASAVSIRFLGLFDTVVSQMIQKEKLGYKLSLITRSLLPAIAQEVLNVVKQNVKGLGIQRVFHITAEDEWRDNFPVTYVTEGYNYSMHGAHSDIGGAYAATPEKNILDYFIIKQGQSKPVSKDNLLKYFITNNYCKVDKVKKEIDFKQTVRTTTVQEDLYLRQKTETLYQLIATRNLIPRFSAVPLHIMAEVAKSCNVPFLTFSQAPKYAFEYKIPVIDAKANPGLTKDALTKYANEEVSYIEKFLDYRYLGKVRPARPKKNVQLEQVIKNKFVHLSAHFNRAVGIGTVGDMITGFGTLDKMFYTNHPTENMKRDIYDHGQ